MLYKLYELNMMYDYIPIRFPKLSNAQFCIIFSFSNALNPILEFFSWKISLTAQS